MLAALLTFAAAAALIVLLPGPDTLVVLRNLVRGGRGQAARTAVGVLVGLAIWVTAASLGISALLRASRTGYELLRIVGAAYLLVLGVQSLRSRGAAAALPERTAAGTDGPRRRSLVGTGFAAGIATDLLNPKVGVFFVTFLPGFVPHGVDVGWATAAFGSVFIAETATYFVALVLLASRITRWLGDARIRRRLDRATGGVLVGFGARLAIGE